jgi:1-aminocyclopropane-1-carboxylate deaminase/D-cysteine desulfhydrase-like pyridoxal-dependent ACC family enzyme
MGMVINTKVALKTMRNQVMGSIGTTLVISIRAISKKVSEMGWVKCSSSMETITRACGKADKSTAMASTSGTTETTMKAHSG